MTWCTDDRRLYWEQRRLDEQQVRSRELIDGYNNCSGMSRARDRHDICHNHEDMRKEPTA